MTGLPPTDDPAEIARRDAASKAIACSRPKIGAREARRIHALLAPRPWEKRP